MPRREDDDVARRPPALNTRILVLAGGFALAVLATLAVFLTDNPQYLRIAVVAVAWAFVLATFAAGRRGTDRVAAAAREAELQHAYELELEREVAARREYELELENELRRETEDAMRYELDALRGDIAALSGLRDEVARVAALRDDVAALASLRQELGQLAELRADMSRLRVELTEQLSSEMLVERIVMRTQGGRLTGEAPRFDLGRRVEEVPPRELTGGWPAVRLDDTSSTRTFGQVHAEPARPAAPPPAFISQPDTSPPEPATAVHPIAPASIARPPAPEPPPSPLDWLAARSLLDEPTPRASLPEVPPRRRSTDRVPEAAPIADVRTEQRPAVRPSPEPVRPEPVPAEPTTTGTRVSEILAANGVTLPSGGRRRRRYRDEDEPDDVLARVLRGS